MCMQGGWEYMHACMQIYLSIVALVQGSRILCLRLERSCPLNWFFEKKISYNTTIQYTVVCGMYTCLSKDNLKCFIELMKFWWSDRCWKHMTFVTVKNKIYITHCVHCCEGVHIPFCFFEILASIYGPGLYAPGPYASAPLSSWTINKLMWKNILSQICSRSIFWAKDALWALFECTLLQEHVWYVSGAVWILSIVLEHICLP